MCIGETNVYNILIPIHRILFRNLYTRWIKRSSGYFSTCSSKTTTQVQGRGMRWWPQKSCFKKPSYLTRGLPIFFKKGMLSGKKKRVALSSERNHTKTSSTKSSFENNTQNPWPFSSKSSGSCTRLIEAHIWSYSLPIKNQLLSMDR